MLSKCHLLLLSLVVVFLLPLFAVAETTNIVMVDVSGSMAGYGYHSQNIMPKARRQLNDFVNFTQSNGHKIKIIQFASNIYETNCPNLIIRRGNTNIYKALLFSQEQIQTGRNNIFFITDGAHNTHPSVNDLCAELEKIKQQHKDSVFYYYVALSESAKQSDVARLFNGMDNFVLLDSLYVPERVCAKVDVQKNAKKVQRHVSQIKSAQKVVSCKESNGVIWLYVLALFAIIVCLVVIVLRLLPTILSAVPALMSSFWGFKCFEGIVDKALVKWACKRDGFDKFMNQPVKDKMQQIQRLTNYIYGKPSPSDELNKLNPKMRELVEKTRINQMGNLPSLTKGTWSGEPGNSSFTVNDEYIWTDRKTGESMPVRKWREKYNIKKPIEVKYKNGEPTYDEYSIAQTKVPYKENYNYSDIKDLHNPVNDNLKSELDPSVLDQSAANPVRDYVENTANDGSRKLGCRNTYHEKRDGETIQVVPDFIHSICTHNGGRSLAKMVQKKLSKQ